MYIDKLALSTLQKWPHIEAAEDQRDSIPVTLHQRLHTYAIAADLCVGVAQRSIGLRLRHWTLCTGASKQDC